MACHNQSFSLLGKRKKKEYGVNLEPEEAITTCKSSSTANTEKTLNIEEEEENDECITTPKSEKHKISAIKCCPPAPLKPRSTARKRKTLMSQGAVYIPCDFPYMDLLFDSDPKSKQNKSTKVEKILQAV